MLPTVSSARGVLDGISRPTAFLAVLERSAGSEKLMIWPPRAAHKISFLCRNNAQILITNYCKNETNTHARTNVNGDPTKFLF